MRPIVIGVLVVLAVYSAILIAVELNTSQDFVRNYFTDIDGPVPFYAVNTTLSVFLLWGTALVFGVGVVCTHGMPNTRRLRWFFVSQIVVFAWLGLDDRFKFHEFAAGKLGIGDHFVLLGVCVCQLGLLLLLGGREVLRRPYIYTLAAASGLFVIMLFLDAVVPHDMVLRLSLEDLAKTWANLCLFAFASQLCWTRLDELKSAKLREFAAVPIR